MTTYKDINLRHLICTDILRFRYLVESGIHKN